MPKLFVLTSSFSLQCLECNVGLRVKLTLLWFWISFQFSGRTGLGLAWNPSCSICSLDTSEFVLILHLLKISFCGQMYSFVGYFEEHMRQALPVLIVPETFSGFSIFLIILVSWRIVFGIHYQYGQEADNLNGKSLCRIYIINLLSVRSGFNCLVHTSDCNLDRTAFDFLWHFWPLFVSEVTRFKWFPHWLHFCLYAFVATGFVSCNIGSGCTKMRRSLECSAPVKVLPALSSLFQGLRNIQKKTGLLNNVHKYHFSYFLKLFALC